MIHLALKHLANQLNQFLKRTLTITEDVVVVSNLIDQDGGAAPNLSNKVVMFLTRIERDTMPFRTSDGRRPPPETRGSAPPGTPRP